MTAATEQSAFLATLTARWHVGAPLTWDDMEHILYLARLGCAYLAERELQAQDTARVWAGAQGVRT